MKLYDDQLIVVTGGSGFIGSSVIRFLNDKHLTNIVVVDELGMDEKWKNLVGKCFVEIVPKDQLFTWLKGKESAIDAFVHLGACSDTLEKNASFLLDNNYQYSIRLAEYAIDHGHRFIYASSAATYGDGSQGFSDSSINLQRLNPLNMYGFSKQLVDQWAQNSGVLDKIVSLKYFNVFGPNEYHKGRMASAICKMVPIILNEEPVLLFKSSDPSRFADGEQQRDFIYVKDAVRMTCAFLENDASGIYNIGCGEPITWNRLANAVFNALEIKPNIKYIDMPSDLINKYQNYSCADMTKTKQMLGPAADCSAFEFAVKDYVCNYLVPGKTW